MYSMQIVSVLVKLAIGMSSSDLYLSSTELLVLYMCTVQYIVQNNAAYNTLTPFIQYTRLISESVFIYTTVSSLIVV